MIDVNDLDGLLELAKDYVDDGLPFLTEPVSYGDLVILVERIIAAEKDAARYRMIKSIAKVIECEEFDMDMLDGQDLDAMVDECIEAMQCNK